MIHNIKSDTKWGNAACLAVAHEIKALPVTADETFIREIGKVNDLCLLKDIEP